VKLTAEEREMLDGVHGRAARKGMEILAALGAIYGAERMVEVTSAQIAGVSYDNLGEAGLEFLADMARGGGEARVLATLNPAGIDVENWRALGIDEEFAANQKRVLETFGRMGVVTTCSCTPYLVGNTPHYGEHIAWSESSAVCYANSVLGARTNREGGPSALAAALTGRTPVYGCHLDENRRPTITVEVRGRLVENSDFGALGKVIGERLEGGGARPVPYVVGVESASVENLKSFCASVATYGGTPLFHMEGITPEAALMTPPQERVVVTQEDLDRAARSLTDATSEEVDLVSLGCPHLSIREIGRLAELLRGRKVRKEFWATTARPTKQVADMMGYSQVIEESGAKLVADTCCVVAPIRGRFTALATDSAKACFYACAKNRLRTLFKPFDEVVEEALR